MTLLRGRPLIAITLAMAVLFTLSAGLSHDLHGSLLWPMVAANTLPLLLIERQPLLVVLIFSVTYPLWLSSPWEDVVRGGHVLQALPTLVAMYATGAWRRPLWLRATALIAPAWMMLAPVAGLWDTSVSELLFVALVLVIVWGLGVVDAGRRAYAAELEVRTAELAAAQQALADQAIRDERSRIARELHDVVAHGMSVITVQAGVGAHLIETRPQRAGDALGIIERTGREVMEELRRMLLVLRPDAAPTCAPQPGLADLPALLETTRAAGLPVTYTAHGTVTSLPAGLDLAVYRVVQECLTNVRKHAPRARAQLCLRGDPDTIEVTVSDTGPGTPGGVVHPGHGLTGMRERVRVYDGKLSISSTPNGFHVTATFPAHREDA